MKEGVHGYFKVGDIVRNESVWGKTLFLVHSLNGNKYQPILIVHFYGKPLTNKNVCNFVLRDVKLMDSNTRPLMKIDKGVLVKLVSKGNVEAKRELIIRSRKNK